MWGSVVRPCPVNEICFHSASPLRGFCLLTEKSFVFLLRSLLCSHWERSCLPIGNTLVFLLGKVEASHWEYDCLYIMNGKARLSNILKELYLDSSWIDT